MGRSLAQNPKAGDSLLRRSVFMPVFMWVVVALLSTGLVGCGKYQSPVVPEAVTPDVVGSLAASATQRAVVLTWASPRSDRRGKELASLDGYLVERRRVRASSDLDAATLLDRSSVSGFEVIGNVTDQSLSNLEAIRERAKEDGASARRARAESEFTNFRFEDAKVQLGEQFVYRVTPTNAYGTGRVNRLARVLFRGLGSEITYPEPVAAEEDLSFDPFR